MVYPFKSLEVFRFSYTEIYKEFFALGENEDMFTGEYAFTKVDEKKQLIIQHHPQGKDNPTTIHFSDWLRTKLKIALEETKANIRQIRDNASSQSLPLTLRDLQQDLDTLITTFGQESWTKKHPFVLEEIKSLSKMLTSGVSKIEAKQQYGIKLKEEYAIFDTGIQDFYNILTKEGFIKASYKLVKSHLLKGDTSQKIYWTGKLNELNYLIKGIKKLIVHPHPYVAAIESFTIDGSPLQKGKITGATPTNRVKSTPLDVAIQCIISNKK